MEKEIKLIKEAHDNTKNNLRSKLEGTIDYAVCYAELNVFEWVLDVLSKPDPSAEKEYQP